MPKSTIITPAVLARVDDMVKQGVSAAEIAREIGCTIGTLRVRCSQKGISLRRYKGGQLQRQVPEQPNEASLTRTDPLDRYHNGSAATKNRYDPAEAGDGRVELKVLVPELIAQRLHRRA